MEPDWISLISTVGFPIVVAMYLMIRMEKVIKDHTDAINELRITMLEMKGGVR